MGMHRKSALTVGVATLFAVGAVGGLAAANGNSTRLRAELSGANEVPVADPDGSGSARVDLSVNEETGEVCFAVRFRGTGTPNRGHIHAQVAGQNGPIVVPLFELAGLPADPRNDDLELGRLEGCVPADAALLEDIKATPGAFYVNLHNARFPAGAIRGQLE
jgi:CHRD domain